MKWQGTLVLMLLGEGFGNLDLMQAISLTSSIAVHASLIP